MDTHSEGDKPPNPLPEPTYRALFLLFSIPTFDWSILIAILFILFLVVGSALISGSEVAYFSMTPNQLKELAEEKTPAAGRILELLKQPDYLLGTILIGNNLFNIALILSTNYFVDKMYDFSLSADWVEPLVKVGLITAMLVLFGEVLPKLYANRFNKKLAYLTSLPITLMSRLFYPAAHVLVNSTQFIEKKVRKSNSDLDLKEIGQVIDLVADDSDKGQMDMLKGIMEFSNISVAQIQKARVNMIAVDQETNFTQLMDMVIGSSYSRLPVYEDDLDNIKGIIYAKDLLEHMDKPKDFNWRPLIKSRLLFVPENKKVDDMLQKFKEERIHLAVVVDEYGGTTGIVTLEDVLERVVGEIQDEYDENQIQPTKLEEGVYAFDAETLLVDVCKFYKIDLDTFDKVRGESGSLGGLLLEIAGRFPDLNEEIEQGDFMFKVTKKQKNRIEKIKVTYFGGERAMTG